MQGIDDLSKLEKGYMPSADTAEAVKDKNLIACIGVFAIGKSTLIEHVSSMDARFSEVVSFTTRPSRGKGDKYRFIDHNEGSINDILENAVIGRLVNFAVHQTTGYIYGTEPQDYQTQYNLLATTSNSFQQAKKLPFNSVLPLVIVADPDTWLTRIRSRSIKNDEYTSRLREAKESLEWSLDSDGVPFIDNSLDDIITTANQFIDIVSNSSPNKLQVSASNTIRNLAYNMLSVTKRELSL